ncbi:MAG: hypothetical protein BZ151_05055 [Desulfobacca sp. 4484_104]|nr:MAG: hypothetical protein BZ151_05055 [Desulfobacca sp. 4484_104]
MAKVKIIVCQCPELALDAQALVSWLERGGAEVQLLPPLCTPDGLMQLRTRLASQTGEWLIAACGPERHAGLFQRLTPVAVVRVVDLLAYQDLESAVAALTLAQSTPSQPEPSIAPVSPEVLIVGGGVGGCQAALDLARGGHKVYLVDRALSIGGIMAQLDKTFPTLDCSICILGPKLVEVASHPNIELLTYVGIDRIAGQTGHFVVDLTLKPRYVDMTKCVGCGSCTEVCPIIVPSRWDLDLKPSKCIRIWFAQAVPLRAAIDKEYCIDCQLCVKACEHQAINLAEEPQSRQLTVGAIILATGARPFDPSIKSEYGYGRIPTVVTNLEYERIVCASGPTLGGLVTPEGRPVQRLAFIQCVGSRDRRFLPYCSGYCCTASIKEAMLALEHQPDGLVFINVGNRCCIPWNPHCPAFFWPGPAKARRISRPRYARAAASRLGSSICSMPCKAKSVAPEANNLSPDNDRGRRGRRPGRKLQRPGRRFFDGAAGHFLGPQRPGGGGHLFFGHCGHFLIRGYRPSPFAARQPPHGPVVGGGRVARGAGGSPFITLCRRSDL